MPKQTAPYGSWKSPITSELIVSEAISITGMALDGDDVYWIEMRPSDGARNVVVRRTPDGKTRDVTAAPYNVRTRVHEYGGGALAVADGVLYFSNFDDQRLYRQPVGGDARPLTPETDMRYADGDIDRRRGVMVCVREDHTSTWQEPVNTLVAIDLQRGGGSRVLVSGNNFYASPRVSPDGTKLAWLAWNHPNMPWDGTELWVGELRADGSVGERQRVAGGRDESVFQPEWSPGGSLYFVSDKSGFWNIFRYGAEGQPSKANGNAEREAQASGGDEAVEALYPMEAEFGMPQWSLGIGTYGFVSEERIVCAYNLHGAWHIADLDTQAKTLQTVPTPFTDIGRMGLTVGSGKVLFTAGSPTMPITLMLHDLASGDTEALRRTSEAAVDDGFISLPQAVEFPTENGLTAHAFHYPPANQEFQGPDGEKPPLMVISHGGPTGATTSTLSLMTQFWTSRGFAVLDVNYGGSTGYGTAYRRRLNGNWGVVDVDDCVNGAMYLVDRGLVDGERLVIRGSSAGGYTTLAALTFRDVFKAGASHYGICDLKALAEDTHKFESRYLDTMIGPYPEREDLYAERSPINFTDRLSCALILFQGLDDQIVSPKQAEAMVAAVKEKGLPVAYVPFEGEQHGFRKAENIRRALDGELYFYSRVLGFDLPDDVEPVEIENLP
ncbi:MAG: S9 family peptidase [Chloroflexi bacterium]|nr:S9 family peptidase [Chloroflexota bacterium]